MFRSSLAGVALNLVLESTTNLAMLGLRHAQRCHCHVLKLIIQVSAEHVKFRVAVADLLLSFTQKSLCRRVYAEDTF